MKKLAAVCVVCLLLALAPLQVLAAGQVYTLKELYMKIEIPDEIEVFTRATSPNDPRFEELLIDGEAMLKEMEEADIYLEGFSFDERYWMSVFMVENTGSREIFDFNQYKESELGDFGEEMMSGVGSNAVYEGVYEHSTVPFALLSVEELGVDMRCYVTVYNGQVLIIALYASQPITSSMNRMMDGVVDSIQFTKTLTNPNPRYESAMGLVIAGIAIAAVIALIVILALRTAKRNAPAANPAMGYGGYPPQYPQGALPGNPPAGYWPPPPTPQQGYPPAGQPVANAGYAIQGGAPQPLPTVPGQPPQQQQYMVGTPAPAYPAQNTAAPFPTSAPAQPAPPATSGETQYPGMPPHPAQNPANEMQPSAPEQPVQPVTSEETQYLGMPPQPAQSPADEMQASTPEQPAPPATSEETQYPGMLPHPAQNPADEMPPSAPAQSSQPVTEESAEESGASAAPSNPSPW